MFRVFHKANHKRQHQRRVCTQPDAPNRTQISFCGQRMQRSGKTNAIILLLINV